MKAPFWYVVKARGDNWSPPFDGWHYRVVGPGYIGGDWTQRRATMFSDIRKAKRRRDQCREEGGEAKVVRVWARLPKPKLPQWVDPTPLPPQAFAVFRGHDGHWWEYTFTTGMRPLECTYWHKWREPMTRLLTSAAPDVWVEAGLRAAAILRKAKK